MTDPVEEKTKLVIDAYRYAIDHNLDITNKEDVTTILKALDPEHSSENEVETFMPMLKAFDKMTKDEVAKREKPESN